MVFNVTIKKRIANCVLLTVVPVFGSIAVKYHPPLTAETHARKKTLEPLTSGATTYCKPSFVIPVAIFPVEPVVSVPANLLTDAIFTLVKLENSFQK